MHCKRKGKLDHCSIMTLSTFLIFVVILKLSLFTTIILVSDLNSTSNSLHFFGFPPTCINYRCKMPKLRTSNNNMSCFDDIRKKQGHYQSANGTNWNLLILSASPFHPSPHMTILCKYRLVQGIFLPAKLSSRPQGGGLNGRWYKGLSEETWIDYQLKSSCTIGSNSSLRHRQQCVRAFTCFAC